jgi:hypothetical protein
MALEIRVRVGVIQFTFLFTFSRTMVSLVLPVLFLLLAGSFACPYLKRRESADSIERAKHDPLNLGLTSRRLSSDEAPIVDHAPITSRPFCKKIRGEIAQATRNNICTVYTDLSADFATLIKGKNVSFLSDLYAGAVRLAFHDAGEISIRVGDFMGPDGCLSTDPHSAGLVEASSIVAIILEPLWQRYCDKVSRADFWVLFAKFSIEAADPTHTISIPYYYGRLDNVYCESGYGRLPDGEDGLTGIQKVFVGQMGLTMDDAGKRQTMGACICLGF